MKESNPLINIAKVVVSAIPACDKARFISAVGIMSTVDEESTETYMGLPVSKLAIATQVYMQHLTVKMKDTGEWNAAPAAPSSGVFPTPPSRS